MKKIIHSITSAPFKLKLGRDARSRCGRIACLTSQPAVRPDIFALINEAGTEFFGTSKTNKVTCKKCINLITIGKLHVQPTRDADPAAPGAAGPNPSPAPVPSAHARMGRVVGKRLVSGDPRRAAVR